MYGCSDEKRQTSPAEEREQQPQVWVVPEESHEVILEEILTDPRVQVCEEAFAVRGLVQEPFARVSIEGVSSEGDLATVTILTFAGPDSSVAGLVAYIEGRGQTKVYPCLVETEGPSVFSVDADLRLTEYAVTEDGLSMRFGEVSSDSTGGGRGGYWDCVGRTAVAGALVCTAKCAPFGPLYADCLGACIGWTILGALVGCAFTELL